VSKLKQLKQRAKQYVQKQDWAKAIAEYKKILSLEPNNPNLANELGDLYLRAGDRVQALKIFEESVEAYSKVELFNNAVAVCKKVLRLAPRRLTTLWKLGEIRSRQGLHNEAAGYFCDFLEQSMQESTTEDDELLAKGEAIAQQLPGNPQVLAKLVDLYEKFERHERAAPHLVELARLAEERGESDKAGLLRKRAGELVGGEMHEQVPAAPSDPPSSPQPQAEGPAVAGSGVPGSVSVERPGPGAPQDEGDSFAGSEGAVTGTGQRAGTIPLESGGRTVELHEVTVESEAGSFVRGPNLSRFPDDEPGRTEDPGEVIFEEPPTSRDVGEGAEQAGAPRPRRPEERRSGVAVAEDGDAALDLGSERPHEPGVEEGPDRSPPGSEPHGADTWGGETEAHSIPSPAEGVASGSAQGADPPASETPEAPTEGPRSVVEPAPRPFPHAPVASDGEMMGEVLDGMEAPSDEEEDAKNRYDLGMAYLEMQLHTDAIREFQAATRDERFRLRSLEMIGLCFLQQGKPNLAIKELRRGLENHGGSERDLLGIHYNLGLAYEAQGNVASAREHFEEVYVVDITFRDVQEKLSQLG
jgi:tetratricopeptide (TPR) repeat protein